MTANSKKTVILLEEFADGLGLTELARAIGDDPKRLKRVLDGTEELGLTAGLALSAFINGLEPVQRDTAETPVTDSLQLSD